MKYIIQLSLLFLATALTACTTFDRQPSSADLLDNRKFCRQIKSAHSHCVEFKNGKMTDNAETLYGKPAEVVSYAYGSTENYDNDPEPRGVVAVEKDGRDYIAYRVRGSMLIHSSGMVLIDVNSKTRFQPHAEK